MRNLYFHEIGRIWMVESKNEIKWSYVTKTAKLLFCHSLIIYTILLHRSCSQDRMAVQHRLKKKYKIKKKNILTLMFFVIYRTHTEYLPHAYNTRH